MFVDVLKQNMTVSNYFTNSIIPLQRDGHFFAYIQREFAYQKNKLTCCPSQLEIILSTPKKRPLSTIRLLGFDSEQKSATEILFKSAENPIELFPRVRVFRVDPMLLRCHTLLHVSCQPMTCRIDLL